MINGYLMWVGKQNDLLAELENREYFHASPFVGEDDEADWKNYGGIWFCNGGYGRDSYGWVEDSRGLTEKEANAAAAALNGHPLIASWRNLQDVDYDLVGEIVHGFWKE